MFMLASGNALVSIVKKIILVEIKRRRCSMILIIHVKEMQHETVGRRNLCNLNMLQYPLFDL